MRGRCPGFGAVRLLAVAAGRRTCARTQSPLSSPKSLRARRRAKCWRSPRSRTLLPQQLRPRILRRQYVRVARLGDGRPAWTRGRSRRGFREPPSTAAARRADDAQHRRLPDAPPVARALAAGRAYTQVRAIDGSWHGLEGSVPIADGAWHHLAATWDGTAQEPTLSLYVDGVLEMTEAGSRHPARSGYTVASRCTAGLCENGMQIGGFYQSGGGGFTGQFFHGLIDEVRVWSRPRTADEIRAAMGVPLAAADDSRCRPVPCDDAGRRRRPRGSSRARPWFAAGRLGPGAGVCRVRASTALRGSVARGRAPRPARATRGRGAGPTAATSRSLLELVVAAVLARHLHQHRRRAGAQIRGGYGLARVARRIAEMPAAMKAGGGSDSGAVGVTAVADDGTPTSG